MCVYTCLQKFERRGRHVWEPEKEKWLDVHPTMMSDEEEVDGKFKVSRQEWRSEAFNEFMETLDNRATSSNRKYPRIDGSPMKGDPPAEIKEWMVCSTSDDRDDIFSSCFTKHVWELICSFILLTLHCYFKIISLKQILLLETVIP